MFLLLLLVGVGDALVCFMICGEDLVDYQLLP